jgi:multidrug efflux pump subunit AcrA (membrane-fusion protein)
MSCHRSFTTAAAGTLLMLALLTGCSRKAPQARPSAPEVLVTTVQPRDVPRVLERVATLDGFINAKVGGMIRYETKQQLARPKTWRLL